MGLFLIMTRFPVNGSSSSLFAGSRRIKKPLRACRTVVLKKLGKTAASAEGFPGIYRNRIFDADDQRKLFIRFTKAWGRLESIDSS